MVSNKEAKKEIIDRHKHHETDVGSVEVQIAILSDRIEYLTEHLKEHRRDHHSRLGLLRLVRRRQKLLNYLRRTNLQSYQSIIEEIGIRG